MRKSAAFILAALLLLLTACAQAPNVTPSGTPQATVLPSSPTPEAITPAPETPSLVMPEEETQIIEVLLPKGSVPETAFSPPEQPVRFYDDVVRTLVPSSEYGHIWPYIGEHFYSLWYSGEVYGLCDDKGRIICDPVFLDVKVLEKDGAKLYAFYKYSRGESRRIEKITLARPDGTWAAEYDGLITVSGGTEYFNFNEKYGYMVVSWRPDIVLEYITVRKDGKWGAIDYYGNEILPCVYNAPLLFSEGLASVLSDDKAQVTFIDSSGNTVLGPFEAPPDMNIILDFETEPVPQNEALVFYQGLVKFYQDGKFGVIDKSGNVVLDAVYDYVSSFYDGTASFWTADGKAGVIDIDGNVLRSPVKTQYYANDKLREERKFYTNNGVAIKLPNGETRHLGNYNIYELTNGNFLLSSSGNRGEPNSWKIIDPYGETVAGPFFGNVYPYISGIVCEYRPGQNGIDIWLTVYDENGERLLPGEYLSVTPFDGRYLVRTDTSAGLLDENKNWVIKVPLYDYMGD